MAGGANDRRGIAQRIRDARQAYRGPFTGEHVERVVSEAGYRPVDEANEDTFRIFRKNGFLIPVNPDWRTIWDNDPTFRCLQRDLGISRRTLLTLLNQARTSVDD